MPTPSRHVIPAQAGIQFMPAPTRRWIPACAGMTVIDLSASHELKTRGLARLAEEKWLKCRAPACV